MVLQKDPLQDRSLQNRNKTIDPSRTMVLPKNPQEKDRMLGKEEQELTLTVMNIVILMEVTEWKMKVRRVQKQQVKMKGLNKYDRSSRLQMMF